MYNDMMYSKEIVVKAKHSNREISLDITLKSIGGQPDCQVGNFYHNFWIRTPYGVQGKRYTSKTKMEKAVEKVLKNRGFDIIKWIDRSF